jgi:hypothetical protein
MKIYAFDSLKAGASKEQLEALISAEVKAAWLLYKEGVIRENYLRTDRPGAVIVLECASVGEAEVHLAGLPFAKAGLVQFTIIPVGPFLTLEKLFAHETTAVSV